MLGHLSEQHPGIEKQIMEGGARTSIEVGMQGYFQTVIRKDS
jgi:hypothetical protein